MDQDFRTLTVETISAYVVNNSLPRAELPSLISVVYSGLRSLEAPHKNVVSEKAPTPPVPIKKTITPDYLISLEDGRRYKSLKRHLAGRGLTPQQYREKWGLKPDYPMVSKSYSAQRSELARTLGLGRKREEAKPVAQPPARTPRARKSKAEIAVSSEVDG